jgi:hypothetical protein
MVVGEALDVNNKSEDMLCKTDSDFPESEKYLIKRQVETGSQPVQNIRALSMKRGLISVTCESICT